jgi:hypothetical protein
LFTHELLDEYTSAYTSSETPFTAWCTVVGRRYAGKIEFPMEKLFRSAWFAYSRLQLLDADMTCKICGPTPETVIWDGVTVAFGQKHLLDTLRPPTVTDVLSPVREKVVYNPRQEFLIDKNMRKKLRTIATAKPLSLRMGEEGGRQRAEQAFEHVEMAKTLLDYLTSISKPLGEYFNAHFGLHAYSHSISASPAVRDLFKQVSIILVIGQA